jgi:predicted porin
MLFLLQGILFAQESYLEEDSVAVSNSEFIDLYFGPGYVVSEFAETGASFARIHMGLVFFNHVDLYISYGAILSNFKKQLIFPSYHKYNQKDISILLQYDLTDWKIRPSVGIGYHHTYASWEPENESNEIFKDQIKQFEFYAGVNYSVTKAFVLELHCGYKFAKDIELVGLAEDSFDGFIFRATMKVRLIKF